MAAYFKISSIRDQACVAARGRINRVETAIAFKIFLASTELPNISIEVMEAAKKKWIELASEH